MSIVRVIECDECRFQADDLGSTTDANTRLNASAQGWTRSQTTRKDFCPECSARFAGTLDEYRRKIQEQKRKMWPELYH